jgi:molybdopterin-guanine dinucleotide biosynthesis protein A
LPALALGLAEVANSYVFALGCDTPFVRRALLERLLDLCRDVDAVVPLWGGRPQPLVAVYHRRLAGALADLATGGERRLSAVVSLPGVRVVTADDFGTCEPDGVSFRTVNTPEEYAAAVRAWADGDPGED